MLQLAHVNIILSYLVTPSFVSQWEVQSMVNRHSQDRVGIEKKLKIDYKLPT